MVVDFHRDFKKELKALPKNHQDQFFKRLDIFFKSPYHPMLNNHKLGGKLRDMRSINITGDMRAIYEQIDKHMVLFLTIANHNNLYG